MARSLSSVVSSTSVDGGSGGEGRQYFFPMGRQRLQCRHEIGKKTDWIVLSGIQGQPGSWRLAPGEPGTDQCSFPKASWGRDESQFVGQPRVQPLDQTGAEDYVRAR